MLPASSVSPEFSSIRKNSRERRQLVAMISRSGWQGGGISSSNDLLNDPLLEPHASTSSRDVPSTDSRRAVDSKVRKTAVAVLGVGFVRRAIEHHTRRVAAWFGQNLGTTRVLRIASVCLTVVCAPCLLQGSLTRLLLHTAGIVTSYTLYGERCCPPVIVAFCLSAANLERVDTLQLQRTRRRSSPTRPVPNPEMESVSRFSAGTRHQHAARPSGRTLRHLPRADTQVPARLLHSASSSPRPPP